ncbi:accessory Sec system protein Asp1 [Liquorilactobacillus aquaticus]|nr:accessory Sec system protein Asp1 [Liquorilactobacillus aquaticus]
MFYIIPSWSSNTLRIEYDFILKIIQMFKKENKKIKILNITYLPNLAYQLNQFGLLNIPKWQVYDVIQNVSFDVGNPLSIDDIINDSSVEKVYHPQGVLIMKQGRLICKLEMFEDRFLSKATYYNSENISHIDIFDARGFLSKRVHYSEDNKMSFTELFNPFGETVLIIDHEKNDRVKILNCNSETIKEKNYASMHELIYEVTNNFLAKEQEKINLIAPVDQRIWFYTEKAKEKLKTVHFVQENNLETKKIFLPRLLADRSVIVFPSDNFIAENNSKKNVISPYATELKLGISNSLSEQIIFWHVQDVAEHSIRKYINLILKTVIKSNDRKIIINLGNANLYTFIHEIIKRMIEETFEVSTDSEDFNWTRNYLIAKKEKKVTIELENMAKIKKMSTEWVQNVKACEAFDRISIEIDSRPAYFEKRLKKSRLLIDVGTYPNIYLQTRAISVGIPQINTVKTRYVKNFKNGIVLEQEDDIIDALNFFLDSLSNWNKALVNNVKKIEIFSGESIVQQIESLF